jgi:polysaccharide pyruvyl transferase WcaK-like protein
VTKRKIRVFLYAGYGHPNTGDESILLGNILSLKRNGLEVDICATSSDPQRTSRLFNIRTVPDQLSVCRVRGRLGRILTAVLLLFLMSRTVYALIFPQCRKLLLMRERLLLKQIELSDAMLIAGGGTLNDMYFGSGVIPLFILTSWARMLRKPIFMGAQTIGPIARPWVRVFVQLMLRQVAFISVRERQSLITLEKLGIGVPCSLALDDAYAVMQEHPKRDHVPPRQHIDGIDALPERNVILVSLRPW